MAKVKSTALAVKSKQTALAQLEDWEIELQKKATDAAAAEQLGIARITHKSGILKMDDKKIDGNVLPHVIVGYSLGKIFYPAGYDPDEKGQTPTCYAFTADVRPGAEAEMVPMKEAPAHENERCKGCPHNVFGTAEKGGGKRCRDIRRVIVIAPGSNDPDAVARAATRQYEVPPGSLKNWGNYLKSLKDIHPTGAPQYVITKLSAEPGEKGAHVLTFEVGEVLPKEFVKSVMAKSSQIQADLVSPFPVIKKDEAPAKPKKDRSRKVS